MKTEGCKQNSEVARTHRALTVCTKVIVLRESRKYGKGK